MSETNKRNTTQSAQSWEGANFHKFLPEAPTQFYFELYRETLELTARRLQAQAEYIKKLSEIDQPGDALAAHSAFAREMFASWFDEGQRLFKQSQVFVAPSK